MAGGTTREKKQAERRARVVAAAMRLASEGGYDAVQMRDVASRADVALGTIYRYFSSKDELLIAGLAGWTDKVREEVTSVEPTGGTAAERLEHVLTIATRSSDRQPKLMAALVTALASGDPGAGVYQRQVEASVSDIVDCAVGDVAGIDVVGIRRVIGHVWFSSLNRWVCGRAPDGSVGDELRLAARLLLAPTRDRDPRQ